MLHHFAHVVTVDRVERPKPHPEMYLTAVARLGASPERSVAFEDSATGLAAARAAGMYTVAVPGPMSDGHDLTGADRRHASLAECTLRGLGKAIRQRATPVPRPRSSLGR
jgi:beta-phosphoglucomutase-like phosphatase (HAD superfamily)